jgi:hypothetical protein
MNTLKFIRNYLLLVIAGLTLVSCSEDNFFLDNIDQTGRSFPVISDIIIQNEQDEYTSGETVQIRVEFWSNDPVQEIVLYDSLVNIRDREVVLTEPAANASFSEESQTDVIILNYEVPAVPEDPTTINIQVEVINENGLSEINTEADNTTIRRIEITAIP